MHQTDNLRCPKRPPFTSSIDPPRDEKSMMTLFMFVSAIVIGVCSQAVVDRLSEEYPNSRYMS